MIYSTPAGGDDEVGGQGRWREGRGPGVHLDDDGGDEKTVGEQALRDLLRLLTTNTNSLYELSMCSELKIFGILDLN